MPEGPEVARTAWELNQTLSNKSILDVRFLEQINSDKYPNMQYLIVKTKINRVYSKGKKIIFDLEYEGYIFHWICSLLMTGNWSYQEDIKKVQDHTIFALEMGDIIEDEFVEIHKPQFWLLFKDTRKMARNSIYLNISELETKLSAIGPDWLFDKIDFDQYKNSLRQSSRGHMQICKFMMEQKYFSGVGNYLRAEILYRVGIHPGRTLESLNDEEIYDLWILTPAVMSSSYNKYGLTISEYFTPSGKIGSFDCLVYGKDKDPFGTEVIKKTFKDGRNTHYVPSYFDQNLNYIGPDITTISENYPLF